jgi:hypothetical protein
MLKFEEDTEGKVSAKEVQVSAKEVQVSACAQE